MKEEKHSAEEAASEERPTESELWNSPARIRHVVFGRRKIMSVGIRGKARKRRNDRGCSVLPLFQRGFRLTARGGHPGRRSMLLKIGRLQKSLLRRR